MSEFVLTGSDVFGCYCRIEQLRYGVPNEMYLYKVVASLRSTPSLMAIEGVGDAT